MKRLTSVALCNELWPERPGFATRRVPLELCNLLQQLPEQWRLPGCQVLRKMVYDSLAVCLAAARLQEPYDALCQLRSLINLQRHCATYSPSIPLLHIMDY